MRLLNELLVKMKVPQMFGFTNKQSIPLLYPRRVEAKGVTPSTPSTKGSAMSGKAYPKSTSQKTVYVHSIDNGN